METHIAGTTPFRCGSLVVYGLSFQSLITGGEVQVGRGRVPGEEKCEKKRSRANETVVCVCVILVTGDTRGRVASRKYYRGDLGYAFV